jgi:hypothetical protein
MKKLVCLVMALTLCAAKAEGNYNNLFKGSTPSEISAFASVVVVLGTVEALGSAGNAVVESVEKVGDTMTVVFKGASNASRTTVKGSSAVLGATSLAVGTSVNVVTMASGFALVSAGQVLAYFPNEAGKALMHQSRYQAPGAK